MSLVLPKEMPIAKVRTAPVAPSLKARAKEQIARLHAEACTRYGRRFLLPTVSFDLRGTTAGLAHLRRNHVQLNAVLYNENSETFIAETIPHEVAHLITFQLYGSEVRAHGGEWQAVMRDFGVRPERTHQFDVSNARVGKMVSYVCNCKEHQLTSRRHAKIMRGTLYLCNRCGTALRIKGEAQPAATVPCSQAPQSNPTMKLPTERMVSYALALAKNSGSLVPPSILQNFDQCASFIEGLKSRLALTPSQVVGPTERQLEYARAIAKNRGIALPAEVLGSRSSLSEWIAAHR